MLQISSILYRYIYSYATTIDENKPIVQYIFIFHIFGLRIILSF